MKKDERIQLLPDDLAKYIQAIAMDNFKQYLIAETIEKLYFNIYAKDGNEELDFDPGWDWCDFDPYGDKDNIILQLKKLKRLGAITDTINLIVIDWLEWSNNITENIAYMDGIYGERGPFGPYRSAVDNLNDEKIIYLVNK